MTPGERSSWHGQHRHRHSASDPFPACFDPPPRRHPSGRLRHGRSAARSSRWLGVHIHTDQAATAALGGNRQAVVVLHEDPQPHPLSASVPLANGIELAADRLRAVAAGPGLGDTDDRRGHRPTPPNAAGPGHWAVELASATDVGAERRRVENACLRVEAHDHGFLVRDPWNTAVAFTHE